MPRFMSVIYIEDIYHPQSNGATDLNSLNVAGATAAALFEIARRRSDL